MCHPPDPGLGPVTMHTGGDSVDSQPLSIPRSPGVGPLLPRFSQQTAKMRGPKRPCSVTKLLCSSCSTSFQVPRTPEKVAEEEVGPGQAGVGVNLQEGQCRDLCMYTQRAVARQEPHHRASNSSLTRYRIGGEGFPCPQYQESRESGLFWGSISTTLSPLWANSQGQSPPRDMSIAANILKM